MLNLKLINKRIYLFIIKRFFVFIYICSSVAQSQQKICYNTASQYSVDSIENMGKGTLGSVYKWGVNDVHFKGKISNVFTDSSNTILLNWEETPPGDYELFVNEINDNCTGASQIVKVKILPLPAANLINTFVCINPLTKALVSNALLDTKLSKTDYGFTWQLDNIDLPFTTSKINVGQTGTYSVKIVDLVSGCSTKNSALVGQSSNSIFSIKLDNPFEINQSIVITVINGIGNYEYSIDGIDFQDSPKFEVSKAGIYSVIVRDKNGCSDENLIANVINYPKFFTPNSDGYNDLWKIDGFLASMTPVIYIYDRYGKLLKTLQFNDAGWDGTLRGYTLPADDYWFTVDYLTTGGIPAIFSAHFSIKR